MRPGRNVALSLAMPLALGLAAGAPACIGDIGDPVPQDPGNTTPGETEPAVYDEPDTNPYLFFTIGAASTTLSELGVQQYEEAAELPPASCSPTLRPREALVGCLPAAPGDACVSEFIARFGRAPIAARSPRTSRRAG
jgi:hypothetical protein